MVFKDIINYIYMSNRVKAIKLFFLSFQIFNTRSLSLRPASARDGLSYKSFENIFFRSLKLSQGPIACSPHPVMAYHGGSMYLTSWLVGTKLRVWHTSLPPHVRAPPAPGSSFLSSSSSLPYLPFFILHLECPNVFNILEAVRSKLVLPKRKLELCDILW
jgi:hypothetical protein